MNYVGELYKQWIYYQKKILMQLNIDNFNNDEVSIFYFEYYFRVLPQIQYEVYISKELINNPLYHDFKSVIETIKQKAINGEDLKPYLSKGIKNLKKSDGMINDWGVYHFHLGDELLSNGFIKRTGELLFIYRDFKLNPNKLYFLDICHHGDWSKRKTIEIVHNNWQEAIDFYKIKNMIDIEPKLNDEEHQLMRDADINSAVVLDDGTSYMMLGGGITAAGTNQEASMLKIRYMKFFRNLENELIDKYKIDRKQLLLKIENGISYIYLNIPYLNEKEKIIPLNDLILLDVNQ
jgi:hypothetical protein